MADNDDGCTRFDPPPPGRVQPFERANWAPPTPPVPETKRNRITLPLVGHVPVWLVVVFGLLAMFGIVSALSGDDTSTTDGDASGAHAACAEFTRGRLKAPASADFPEYDDPGVSIVHAGATWTVRSFVDAENSFGADIRTDFVCMTRVSGDQWHLESWTEI